MAEKMLMLALSPTMEEGTIVSWNKKEGDTVASGDTVCEVETDKATMDYESMQEGTILKILVKEGESAKIEQPIALIGEEGEDIGDMLKEIEAGATESEESAAPEESTEESQKKAEGETPEEAAKEAPQEAPSKSSEPAKPAEKSAAPQDRAQAQPQTQTQAQTQTAARVTPQAGKGDEGHIKSSPLARNMAAEAGIDLASLSGSGPDGRIVKKDVEQAIKSGPSIGVSAPGLSPAAVSSTGIEEKHTPVGQKRKVIAQRLSESKFSAPHYYLTLSVSTDSLTESRRRLNDRLTKQGGEKLSLNAFLIKLTAEAIKRHPVINSSWEGKEIHTFGSIDIGLAVALEDGLITPVVKNCGGKGIIRIDRELQELITKARSGKLTPEEYSGATFSISNLGSYGIEEFTAIINPPASAILAVGATAREPIVLDDGSISADNRMKLTLSCDHRVIDGAVGAEFLATLKRVIEDPLQALI